VPIPDGLEYPAHQHFSYLQGRGILRDVPAFDLWRFSMRLAVELTLDKDELLIRNKARFDYCTWEESDQPEEIIEYTFPEIDAGVGVLQEASGSRILAQCKSAEDAELVLTMFNILQRAMQEA
jgi:hypothetical protein